MSHPVIEIFGPTIQGEGVDQGTTCHFVRFGGCDYRCTWCDTPYAVLPAEVRANATKMEPEDIVLDLIDRPKVPWVILSGGNPALHDLSKLVRFLQEHGFQVAVETQGSRWREWMADVDRLCVSPKPPSAQESKSTIDSLGAFLIKADDVGGGRETWLFLKVPIFTPADLDFAELIRGITNARLYLSAGNDAGRTVARPDRVDRRSREDVQIELADRYRWLIEEVLKRPSLVHQDVILQAQMHVIAWGNEQGR